VITLFQRLVGLLYGADADAVLLAQAAYGRQFFAVAIQPLFNTFGQQIGQMLVTRHRCIPVIARFKNQYSQATNRTQIPF
jgi:glutamate 5-kinase